METVIESPGLRKTGGFFPMPTPAGYCEKVSECNLKRECGTVGEQHLTPLKTLFSSLWNVSSFTYALETIKRKVEV
jgi:hypothetical protein